MEKPPVISHQSSVISHQSSVISHQKENNSPPEGESNVEGGAATGGSSMRRHFGGEQHPNGVARYEASEGRGVLRMLNPGTRPPPSPPSAAPPPPEGEEQTCAYPVAGYWLLLPGQHQQAGEDEQDSGDRAETGRLVQHQYPQ